MRALRTYVRLIVEDYEGLGDGGAFGLEFGSSQDLYNVFLRPFTDVFSTTAGKTKELSQKVQTLGRSTLEALGTTFLPFFSSEHEKIRANEKQALDKIKQEYAHVYKRTWDAVQDNDVVAASFMYDPAKLVTAAVIKHAPTQVFNLINVLAGGALDKVKKTAMNHGSKKIGSDIFQKIFTGLSTVMDVSHGKKHESRLVETLELREPIKKRVAANLEVVEMMKATRQAVRRYLESSFDLVRSVSGSKTIADLERKLGKKTGIANKIAQLKEPERSQVEGNAIAAMKQAVKKMVVDSLKGDLKKAQDGGVPDDHPFVTDVKKTIGKIEAV